MKQFLQKNTIALTVSATIVAAIISASAPWKKIIDETKGRKKVHIIIMSSPSKTQVTNECRKLIEHGYSEAKVYKSNNNIYVISIDKCEQRLFNELKSELILSKVAPYDTYPITDEALDELIYPSISKNPEAFYIVTNSTKSKKEALFISKELHIKYSLNPEVYLTANGHYAVVLFNDTYEKADEIMFELISKGVISNDSFIITSGLIERINEEISNIRTSDNSSCYLITYSTETYDQALYYARKLKNKGINLPIRIWKSTNGNFAITFDAMPCSNGYKLKKKLLSTNKIPHDSYLARNGLVEIVL